MKQRMLKNLKNSLSIFIILTMLMSLIAAPAWAASSNPGSGADAGASSGAGAGAGTGAGAGQPADAGSLVITSYTVDKTTITKGMKINASLHFRHIGVTTTAGMKDGTEKIDISRLVDSFSGGKIDYAVTSAEGQLLEFDVSISGLTYSGSGKSLKLMVGVPGKAFEETEVTVTQAKEYEEPVYEPTTPSQPEPIPAPMVIISRDELGSTLKAKESRVITVHVKNVGDSAMRTPIISFTPSEALMLPGGSSSIQMNTIQPGKTETVKIEVQAMDEITGANQYLEAEVKFYYYNLIGTVEGSGNGKISIPAKVTKKTEDKEDEEGIDSPVPNIIIDRFNYGGASVAAGSEFNLFFRFVNTSSSLAVENVVVTVDGGEGLLLNGSANTFYFDKVKAGKSKTVTVPMKAAVSVQNSSQPVSVNFKYEYVDKKKRTPTTADLKIAVPVYQPDKFEIDLPKVPVMAYVGDEIPITMNYVNKSKGQVLNVEASIEGESIEALTPVQNIGNLEAGKSGTISFAVTALEAGDAQFTIKVSYEDGNGDVKTREFPVTMPVEEMVYEDPGMGDPGMEEPTEETGGISPLIIAAIAAAIIIAAIIIIKKRKKAKAARKEAEMWARWDEEMSSENESDAQNKESDTQNTDATQNKDGEA